MQKALFSLFIILLVIIFAELGYYFIFTANRQKSANNIQAQSAITPTIQASSSDSIPGLTVLYQSKADTEGRTIIYDYIDVSDPKHHGFVKTGLTEFKDDPKQKSYLVGSFDKTEPVPFSKDVYLYLFDPINKASPEKVRLILETSPQYSTLSKWGVETLRKKIGAFTYKSSILSNEFTANIRSGDTLIAFPFINNSVIQKDANNVMIIEYLVYRRFN